MASKTIVITGASDGIGAAAARRLHAAGHRVVVVGRNPGKTAGIAAQLGVEHHVADFARLDDVRYLAADLNTAHGHIDVLVNNAGALHESFAVTPDGYERTFQVNHVAPYLLTRLLLGNLLAGEASVVWTSSMAARAMADLHLDDTFGAADPAARYRPLHAYGSAKLAALLVMAELHRRYADQGLSSVAFHPGVIASRFSADGEGVVGWFYRSRLKNLVLASPEKGADQLVRLAEGRPGVDWEPGRYYERGRPDRRPALLADPAAGRAVWERTEELLATLVD